MVLVQWCAKDGPEVLPEVDNLHSLTLGTSVRWRVMEGMCAAVCSCVQEHILFEELVGDA